MFLGKFFGVFTENGSQAKPIIKYPSPTSFIIISHFCHYNHQNHHSSIFDFIIFSAQLKERVFQLSFMSIWVGIFSGKKSIAAPFWQVQNFGASQHPLFILVRNLPSISVPFCVSLPYMMYVKDTGNNYTSRNKISYVFFQTFMTSKLHICSF